MIRRKDEEKFFFDEKVRGFMFNNLCSVPILFLDSAVALCGRDGDVISF